MSAQMIVHVTQQLKNELAATGRVLATVDDSPGADPVRMERTKLNDRDHFTALVESLEPLVIAALAATSSFPLTSRPLTSRPLGARFDMGAGTQLAHHVSDTVSYLRDTVSGLLTLGGFSQYKSDNAAVALGMLKKLNGLLLAGIIKQAEADLVAVRAKGATPLIHAAERLAKLAAAKTSTGDSPQDATAP
jgi:hypothetical protein